jgi:hypothetical protein
MACIRFAEPGGAANPMLFLDFSGSGKSLRQQSPICYLVEPASRIAAVAA